MDYTQPLGTVAGTSYNDGSPTTKGSIVPGKAIENPQREILAVIQAAGLTPDAEDLTQLHDAIMALILSNVVVVPDATDTVKGKVELATNTEALGGSDTTRAVTSAGLASSKNLSASGYMKLPGGLVLQWGTAGNVPSGGNVAVTLPVANSTASYVAFAQMYNGGTDLATGGAYVGQIRAISASQITIRNLGPGVQPFYYFVIGA